MHARFVLIAAAALTSASAFAAEPRSLRRSNRASQQPRLAAGGARFGRCTARARRPSEQQSPPPAKPHRASRA